MTSFPTVLLNGGPAAHVGVLDRGLHYGDGLFETCAVHGGVVELWDRHLARLRRGCETLGIPAPPLLTAEVKRLCAGIDRGVVKVIVTRGAGGRGYRPPSAPTPTRLVFLDAFPAYPPQTVEEGVRVRLCQTPLGHNPVLAGIKHLNRLEQVLARAEWHDPAILEGLMLDLQGRVVEGTMTNLFLVRDGALHTPDLTMCGVAGVMRALVLELAADLAIETRVQHCTLADVYAADEVFLSNSLIGVWPVRAVESATFIVGLVTRRIARAVQGVLRR